MAFDLQDRPSGSASPWRWSSPWAPPSPGAAGAPATRRRHDHHRLARLHRRRGQGAQGAGRASGTRPPRRRRSGCVYNGGNDNALQKTVAGFTAGNYPDVAYQYGSSAAQLARQPKLVDLTDTGARSRPSTGTTSTPPSAQAATVDGKVVGVPALVDNLVLVYNKTAVRQAAGVPRRRTTGPGRTSATPPQKLTDPATQDLRLGLRQRRQRGHRLALPRPALAGRRRPAHRGQHQARVRLRRRQGGAAAARRTWPSPTSRSTSTHGNGNYLNLFNSGKIAMLWTGPVGPVEHQRRRRLRRHAACPATDGNHETISGPGPLHGLRPLRAAGPKPP